MHIVYLDDSGDESVRVYSGLAVPATDWRNTLAQIRAFRRMLKAREGIFVTVEFHATDFVGGRGRISLKAVPKGARCRIFKETLQFISRLPGVRLFNAAGGRAHERLLFERMLNRINITMRTWGSHAILISDYGKDYTSLVRRMGVYNPIPSMYGVWPGGATTRNIPLHHIVEDLVYRDSKRSYFIQLADFCAYSLLRSERPLPARTKYGLDKAFYLLQGICVTECFAKDPRKLGIIRET